jgi:copper chaperone
MASSPLETESRMYQLDVPDMTCGHCASTITRAVKDADAAAGCEVDLQARRVQVESAKPASAFLEAIAKAGYTPSLTGTLHG